MRRRQVISVTALCLAALLLVPAGASGKTKLYRARHALRYIVRHQSADGAIAGFSAVGTTADAVLDMVAARRGPGHLKRALDYLSKHVGDATSIGLKAKVAMAAVAGGRNPRHFGGKNLIRAIKSSQRKYGHYGKGGWVIDQALAMLALVAADVQPRHGASRWLQRAECPDGGWQFDAPYHRATDSHHCHRRGKENDFTRSDTNTTSYAVQALEAAARSKPVLFRRHPFAYFRRRRDPVKHGWGYDLGSRLTDSNSTALVLQAYAAAGRRHLPGSMRALKRLQYRPCSKHFPFAFAFTWSRRASGRLRRTGPDLGATVGAVLGLLKQPLPVAPKAVTNPIPKRVRC